MEIRALTEADAADYRSLRLRALQEAPAAFATTHAEELARPLAATVECLRAQVDGERLTLAAHVDGALVGVVTLLHSHREKTRHKGQIVAMYVAPEARRRGIGRALLEAVIARARQIAGLEQLHLGVVSTNTAACRLYHLVGFETYGVEPEALKFEGRAYDEDLMVLRLARR